MFVNWKVLRTSFAIKSQMFLPIHNPGQDAVHDPVEDVSQNEIDQKDAAHTKQRVQKVLGKAPPEQRPELR